MSDDLDEVYVLVDKLEDEADDIKRSLENINEIINDIKGALP